MGLQNTTDNPNPLKSFSSQVPRTCSVIDFSTISGAYSQIKSQKVWGIKRKAFTMFDVLQFSVQWLRH